MSHKPNPQHLPPSKSAAEYERELATLTAAALEVWVTAYAVGYADRAHGEKFGHTPNPHQPEEAK
jgi:hypothetical protein